MTHNRCHQLIEAGQRLHDAWVATYRDLRRRPVKAAAHERQALAEELDRHVREGKDAFTALRAEFKKTCTD